jgi:hypothetical protein
MDRSMSESAIMRESTSIPGDIGVYQDIWQRTDFFSRTVERSPSSSLKQVKTLRPISDCYHCW